jgi:outer membrane lipoprotein-sorting protein
MERFAFVLALICPIFAQSTPDIRTIIEGVTKAYATQQQYDVVCITTMEQHSAEGKASIKARSRIAEQDPNKFRLEQDLPEAPFVLIGDGTDVWGVSPTLNQYTKVKPHDLLTFQAWMKAAKSGVFDPPVMLRKEAADSKLTREESIAIDGSNVACFVIKVSSPNQPEYTLWVEKGRFVIRRIRLEVSPSAATRGLGASMTTEFISVNIGVAPPDSTFVFTPSPAATEVDKF